VSFPALFQVGLRQFIYEHKHTTQKIH